MHIATLVGMLALAAPAAAESASSHAEAAPTPRRRPRFVVEYLPAFAYDRESISLRFRVENPGREPADCTVEVVLSPAAGEKASPEPPAPVRLRVLPGKKRSGGFALPVSGWSRAEVRFDAGGRVPAASAGKDARAAALVIRRFPEDKDIPPLRAAGDRLYVRAPRAKAPPAGSAAISDICPRMLNFSKARYGKISRALAIARRRWSLRRPVSPAFMKPFCDCLQVTTPN